MNSLKYLMTTLVMLSFGVGNAQIKNSKTETVKELRKVGYKGFLMGENFMKEENPAEALTRFISNLQ